MEKLTRGASFCPRQGAMRSHWKRLACFLVGTAISPAIFFFSVIIQYVQTVLPPGIDEVWVLRFCQTWMIAGILLGIVLEALGLSTVPKILRIWVERCRPGKDPSLDVWDQDFDGVPVTICTPKTASTAKRKAVVFFHGGCGIMGSIGYYERFLRYIAKTGDSTLVMVRYGLGPENPFPSQFDECLKVSVFLMKHADDYGVDSSRIIISGDSFGGCVAAHICQVLADRSDLPKVYAQVLLYPVLQALDLSLPSYQQNRRSPILWRRLVPFLCLYYFNKPTSYVDDILKNRHVPEATRRKYQKWVSADLIPERFKARGYTPPEPSQFNPQLYDEVKVLFTERCSPLIAEDAVICKLPQTFLMTCEFDILRDDGLLYLRRLTDNRVPVTWSHIENGLHGLALLYGNRLLPFSMANRIVHDFAEFVRRL